MALTARQRNALPAGAFLDPKNRRFPVPTKAQAQKARISEAQRVRTLRNALARAAQPQARGVKRVSPTATRKAVANRGAGRVASIKPALRSTATRRGRR